MNTSDLSLSLRPAAGIGQDKRKSDLFAVGLPMLMAVLLALVPLIGKLAGPLLLLALVPMAVWFAITDTEKALYVYFAWCWMDGTIRGLFGLNAISILARDLLLIVIVLGWFLQRIVTREKDPLRVPPGTLLIVLFVVNCVIQVFNPYSLGLMSDLAGFKIHFAFLPLLFVGYDVFRRREQVRAFLIFLTLATLVISIVSVVQYYQGPGWTYTHFPGSKDVISQDVGVLSPNQNDQVTGFRPPGTTTFGGGTGGFVGMILPLTFALVLLSGRLRFSTSVRVALVAAIFAFIVTMLINSVRSALVSGIVGVMICGMLGGGRNAARVVVVGALCLVIGLLGWSYSQNLSNGHVADRFGSTFANPTKALHDDRMTFFDQFDYLIIRAPLGIGLGRVGAATGQSGAGLDGLNGAIFSESYLGSMMAETGILGALLISCITILFLLRGFGILRLLSDEDNRLLAAALLACLVVISANFFVTPVLLGLPGGALFWTMNAMLLRAFDTGTLAADSINAGKRDR